jgi:NAD(P)-dependent dehydrogenase (short-subunit alcohol dehydrogenase family)
VTGGRLQDKTIVIVGGTAGLGLSAAQACISQGATVVVVGRDQEKCGAAVGLGRGRLRAVAADATQPDAAENAIRAAQEEFGDVDGLYHVAGGSGRAQGDGPLDAITDAGWEYTLRLNLDSVFYSNRAILRYWLERGRGGSILNMASVLGFAPSPHFFATHAYAAAKAAIIGLTRSAAAYYASRDIRVNALAPALVDTPMAKRAVGSPEIRRFIATKQPLEGGRVGLASDLDSAVVYFLAEDSRYVTGQVLCIDGGWCLSDGQLPDDDKHSKDREQGPVVWRYD